MNKIINYFLQGLLYIVPISVTFYVVIWSFNKVDSILPFDFPGLGLIVIFVAITIIGMIGSILIKTPINSFFVKALKKAPLLKTIFSSVKDLMNTFVGGKKGFDHAVLVKIYENSTIERIGFVTNEDLQTLNINNDRVLVYLPHSYAFSGQLFIVDKKNITTIDSSSSDVMKLIVSGGVSEIEN
tara:strand:+ start:116 stop:667 length:552 start_codon:yes stop_codon:yes gene_type:complete